MSIVDCFECAHEIFPVLDLNASVHEELCELIGMYSDGATGFKDFDVPVGVGLEVAWRRENRNHYDVLRHGGNLLRRRGSASLIAGTCR